MTGLSPEKAAQFARGPGFVSAQATTTTSGIAALLPNADIDDYVFEPYVLQTPKSPHADARCLSFSFAGFPVHTTHNCHLVSDRHLVVQCRSDWNESDCNVWRHTGAATQ